MKLIIMTIALCLVSIEEDPQQTKNFEFRWNVDQGNAWHWDRINKWLDAGTFDREWELDEGETTLKIWTREDATMLDCLFITSNHEATDEAAANARVPDDDDREAQISGTQKSVAPI